MRQNRQRPAVLVRVLVLALLVSWGYPGSAQAAIAYVQSKSNSPNNSSLTSLTAVFTSAQTAGNLNVVVVGAGTTTATASVSDSKGNAYSLAVGPTVVTGLGTAWIYYAKNIAAATAGANTVTVTFSTAVQFPDIRIGEYSGLDTVNPLDVTAVANGTGALSDSGFATTTNAAELLIGSNWMSTTTSGAGTGYTSRQISGWDGDILEDRIVSSTGAYDATAPISPSGNWIMQMAAFKAAGGGGDTTAPTAPSGLSATSASSSQINLTWTASTDNVAVTGYRVERCTGSGCSTFSQVSTPTGTSYSDTGLGAGTSYAYRVRATDAAGNLSTYSATATATTSNTSDTTAPSTPSGLTATAASSTQINLSWSASTDNVAVTGYKVERCQGASCTTFAQISTPTSTSYSDTGLTASTSYSYRIRATDAAGNLSTYSTTASATTQSAPDTTAPTAPGGLTATAASSTQINLSWTGSTDNVAVTGYKVERCQGASCTTFAQISTPTSTSYSDTGLSASTSYSYRVRATDAAGNLSSYSAVASATTPTAGGSSGPVAWWKLDEGSGTTAADSSGNGNTATLTGGPTWTTGEIGEALTFSGTKLGSASGSGALANLYTTGFTVSAWIKRTSNTGGRIVDKDNNSGGWFFGTSNSAQINLTSDQDTSGVTALTSSGTITLNTWTHVLATWDGTAGSTHMHLYINGVQSDGSGSSGVGPESDDSTTPLGIGNRQVDTARPFTGSLDDVRIYNRVLSSTEIQALADATAPGAPSGLTATAASGTQINLSWTAATDNIGVTGYLVERCQGASCSTFAQIATPTATSYSDTGLTASTSYSYRVRATDAAGNLSSYSSTASAATSAGGGDTTPPSAPTGLSATATSSSQINLTWTASTDNAGVTGYRVERCSGSACSTFAQIATPTVTNYSDTGLTASTSYSYRVRATDAAGNLSAYSSTVSATTQAASDTTPPSAPTGLGAIATSSTQINLSWTASTDNVAVVGYRVEKCQGASCTTFAQIGAPTVTNYAAGALTANTSYSFRVLAVDAAGNLSGYSSIVSVSTLAAGICD